MIVTPCTRDSQTKKSPGESIDGVIKFIRFGLSLVGVLIVLRAQPKKAQAGILSETVFRLVLHQVARQLVFDELVERKIFVQHPDHPITILVSVCPLLHPKSMSLIFCIPGYIEPMPPPSLAIVRRLQKRIHQLRQGGIVIFFGSYQKFVNLLGRGWQAQ